MQPTTPGRAAFAFGLRGEVLSVDTACSSSLVTTHLARDAMLRGTLDAACIAGINTVQAPHTGRFFTRAGMLSPEGRCKVLDASANGYVRAEAVVAMRVEWRPLSNTAGTVAILGSGVNHTGTASAITAPSGHSQQVIMHRVFDGASHRHGVQSITSVLLHGTGTAGGIVLLWLLSPQSMLPAPHRYTTGRSYRVQCFGSPPHRQGHRTPHLLYCTQGWFVQVFVCTSNIITQHVHPKHSRWSGTVSQQQGPPCCLQLQWSFVTIDSVHSSIYAPSTRMWRRAFVVGLQTV